MENQPLDEKEGIIDNQCEIETRSSSRFPDPPNDSTARTLSQHYKLDPRSILGSQWSITEESLSHLVAVNDQSDAKTRP